MNTLFEEFVGRTLKSALRGSGLDVQLQGPRRFALEELHSKKPRFATRPDVVISREGSPLIVIDTKWKRLKVAIDDAKRGVGQADVYQMMAYAHVYECSRLMLLYPHHHEVANQEGMVAVHQIANKQDFLIGITTVDLLNPKRVKLFFKDLLLGEGTVFNLSNIRSDFGQSACSVA